MPSLLEKQGAVLAQTRRPATLPCAVRGLAEGLAAIPFAILLGIALFAVPAVGWFCGLAMLLAAPLCPFYAIWNHLNEYTVECPGCHFRYAMQRGKDGRCRVCLTRFVWINANRVLAVPPCCC
jgi:hypothetical protein